jgi:hypothetical protein
MGEEGGQIWSMGRKCFIKPRSTSIHTTRKLSFPGRFYIRFGLGGCSHFDPGMEGGRMGDITGLL